MRVAILNDTAQPQPHQGRHFGCVLVMRNLVQMLAQHDIYPAWSCPSHVDWRMQAHLVPPNIDGIIVNGEGSIHDSAARWKPRALAAAGSFARDKLGVPAILLNATLFRNEDRIYDDLRSFSGVFVRDGSSGRELKEKGIEHDVLPDLTFAFDLPSMEPLRKGICVTDSRLKSVTDLLAQFSDRRGYPIQAIREGRARGVQRFLPGLRQRTSFAEFLAKHELAITGRFHGVTTCLLTRTPFIAIESNTPKIANLLNDVFATTSRLTDIRQIENLDLWHYAFWSSDELECVDLYCSSARQRIDAMFGKIAEILRH
jgi:hypothetical protein